MNIIPFEPKHLIGMKVQRAQADLIPKLTEEYGRELVEAGPAVTGMIDDEVIFCAGRGEVWKDRWLLWSIMGADAGKYMVGVKRVGDRLISTISAGRLEAYVKPGFDEGRRLVEMLGMQFHHHEERFMPDGSDVGVYVRLI